MEGEFYPESRSYLQVLAARRGKGSFLQECQAGDAEHTLVEGTHPRAAQTGLDTEASTKSWEGMEGRVDQRRVGGRNMNMIKSYEIQIYTYYI